MHKRILIVVASENPIKLRAAELAFHEVFLPEPDKFLPRIVKTLRDVLDPDDIEVVGVAVKSAVRDQPLTEEETFQGAKNRLEAIQKSHPEAHYWISMEGGIVDQEGVMEEIGYVLAAEQDGDRFYRGQVPRFEIPFQTAERIRQGMEMGPANDQVFGLENSKQEGGMAGIVTDCLVDRSDIYYVAAQLALSSLKNKHLYK